MVRLERTLGEGLLAAVVLALSTAARAETFHVDPGGNDSSTGNGSFATLKGARDAIRRMKAARGLREPVRVIIAPGTYRITEPFVLEPEDSGTESCPITYMGHPENRPVLSGGRAIGPFRKEGKLWVVRAGGPDFSALWIDGERRTRARSPNQGYFFTQGKAAPGKDPATGKEIGRDRTAFRARAEDLPIGEDLSRVEVVVYHSWETSIHHIASIERDTSTVVFTGPAAWPFENWGPRQRYRLEDFPLALDEPGEWYLDRKAGEVSCFPREGEDFSRAETIVGVARQLIVLAGKPAQGKFVEHVHLANLRLLHTEWAAPEKGHSDGQAAFSIPGAVEAVGARHSSLEGSEVGHVGTYGVWLRAGCKENRIAGNEIHDLGAGGVRIGEGASPPSEAEAAERNVVENNFIHDGGKILSGGVGVWIGRSSHNTISHNEICDFDYTGVSVGWSWGYDPSSAHHNVIEHNHIHDLGRGVLNDLGAIYTLGDSPGTIERHNRMHDIHSWVFGGWGVYTDEGSTGILIEDNIVYNTSSGCFHQHYGKENILRNNVFAFGIEGVLRRSREEEHSSFTFERNLVLARGTPFHIVGWSNGHYRIDSNLYWDYLDPRPEFAGLSFEGWKGKGRDTKSIVAEPGCVDAERFDFRLKPDSPALTIGFKPIDPAGIGLTGDPAWVEAPRKVRRVPYRPPAPPEPEPLADDFEDTPPGEPARRAMTYGETAAARIRVVEENAASGRRCLKFTDAAGLDHRFNPHLVYVPGFKKGTIEASFDLRLETGAVFYHEWRDSASPYHAGPSLRIEGGRLLAGGKQILEVPSGKWIRIEVSCRIGKDSDGAWDLGVTLPGEPAPRVFAKLPSYPGLRELAWLGFVADADAPAVFSLDRLSVKPR